MNNKKYTLLALLALVLGLGLFLAGCESDSVAPNEELPALTNDEKAGQSAAMASAAAHVLPELVRFTPGPNKNEYSYTIYEEGVVEGMVYFDFRLGGADGAPAAYNGADWARMNTADGMPIIFHVGIGGMVYLDFDITASLVQATNTATLLDGSGGTFTAGQYVATFSFSNVEVTAGDNYPAGGTMTFVTGGTTLLVTFDGDDTAVIALDGVDTWVLNLDDASVTGI